MKFKQKSGKRIKRIKVKINCLQMYIVQSLNLYENFLKLAQYNQYFIFSV